MKRSRFLAVVLALSAGMLPAWGTSAGKITGNANCSAILGPDSVLYMAGLNTAGQLGLGDSTARTTFTAMGGGRKWLAVGGSQSNAFLAIQSDSTLWSWGIASSGNLGTGLTSASSPVQVGTAKWLKVATGGYSSAVIGLQSDSSLWGWGSGASYGNGDTNAVNQTTPQRIGSSSVKWLDVATSGRTSFAIRADSTLWAWGSGSVNDLPLGTNNVSVKVPTQVGTDKWLQVTEHQAGGAAIRADSTLWGWGYPNYSGFTSAQTTPTQLLAGKWLKVCAKTNLAGFAIRSDSTLWEWGSGSSYVFGNGSTSIVATPAQLGTDKWLDIGTGFTAGLGLKADGKYYAWGSNGSYQGGTGTNSSLTAPTLTSMKTTQTITFAALADVPYSATPIALSATATSGLTVSFSSSNTSVATVSDSTLTLQGLGSVTITASQSGDGTYFAAPSLSRTFTVTKVPQTLTFTALSTKTYGGGAFALGASASSGLTVSYASSNTSVATVSGDTVTLVGAGTADITASQAGNSQYDSAASVTRTLTVGKASQSITFASLAAKTFGSAAFALGATAASGLTVTYASSDTAVATVSGDSVTLVGAGTADITASQAGNANYDSAASVTRTLTVNKASQSITFSSLAAKTYGDADFGLTATASSGLSPAYSSSNAAVATVSGSTVTIVGAGTTLISASQAGNTNYDSASTVAETLTVNKASQTITFAALASKSFGDTAFSLGATASSGLSPTYASSNTAVATVSGSTVTLVGSGSASIIASQAGNGNYDSAASVTRTLTVGKAAQSITFDALPSKAFGDPAFSLSATATSGLSISYASSNTSVATVSGSTVTLVGAGTASITASQTGNANYDSASSVTRTLTVGKASQSITFAALAAKTYGDAAFSLGATASSGLSVTYASSNPAVATVSGSTVTIVGAGSADITASQAGNGNYDSAAPVTRTLTVGKSNQSITFASLAAKSYGDAAFSLGATSSSGLSVTYASSNPAVATVSGSTVTIVGAGTTLISASQAGNTAYDSAASVSRALTVSKASQSVTFGSLAAKAFGDAAFGLGATASSGLTVAYASSNTAVATLSGSTVTLVGAGTVTITASQAGNGNYDSAASVTQTLTIGKAAQTITFGTLSAKAYGDPAFSLGATASSGLSPTYASSNTAVATVSGSTVTLVGSGSASITASQAGNGDYDSAASVTRTLTVGKAAQSITFNALASKAFGDPAFALGATATSGLPITYATSNTSVAAVSGSTVTIVGAGTAVITASQAGNADYDSAASVVRSLTVGKASQSITFAALGGKAFGDAPFALGATASSGLPVAYSSSNTAVATVSGATVTLVGAGTTTITASQAGNADYDSASPVTQTLTIGSSAQSIAFNALAPKTFGDAAFSLDATATSGLPVAYASSNPAVATVSGSTVTIVGAGTTSISASQAGNADYGSAVPVSHTLTVGKAAQTLAFAPLAGKAFGDSAFSLSATASSGLAIAYASSNASVAAVSGSTVTIVGAGFATITASQGGNANYDSAASVARALTVGKAPQAIAFDALPAKTYGDAAFALAATAGSGLAVAFSSSNPSVASVSGNTVTLVGAGTAAITASQAGDANHDSAASVVRALTVAKAPQTLVFDALPAKTFGDAPIRLAAAAASGLPVSYSVSDTSVARITGDTLAILASGQTTVTASQAGNGNYLAAPPVARTLTVVSSAQAIQFAALPPKTYGDADFALAATSPSGLPVTFASSDTLVAKISGAIVSIRGAGTTTITASQSGGGSYAAAPDVARVLTVLRKPQSLALPALPAKTFGDADFAPGAVATSGLPAAYASSDPSVAAIQDGKVRILKGGLAVITASQEGDANHSPAAPVSDTLRVAKAPQTLAFSLGADTLKTPGDGPLKLAAASSAGLPPAFSSSDTSVARITGDTLLVEGTGTASITAAQSGDARYLAAVPVVRTLRVRIAPPAAFAVSELQPDGSQPSDTLLTLSWPAKARASAYRLQARLDTAAAPFLDTLVADTACVLRAAFAARVFWRLSAVNATGPGGWSGYAAFTVRPRPPLPIDAGRIPVQAKGGTGTTVELTWPASETATRYRLQVAGDTAAAALLDTSLAGTGFTLVDLPVGAERSWRVAPANGPSAAPFTPWLAFRVKEKDDGAVTRGAVIDSAKPVRVSDVISVTTDQNSLEGVKLVVTESKQAPANLPPGFLPLTGSINLDATLGTTALNDGQITITLHSPDTALSGAALKPGDRPMVYLLDSATGGLEALFDLPRDSSGNLVLPLSKGKAFLLAIDTVAPVVVDSTPPVAREPGTAPVISGTVADNVKNCRAVLHFRKGGEEAFDSVAVSIDADGRFQVPLSLELDGSGFEYALTASDGRNRQVTPHSDIPVSVKALKAADSLPALQWRLFALPTLPDRFDWDSLMAPLGRYGQDWKLYERTAAGLAEFGAGLGEARAGTAYWLKSRKRAFQPSLKAGVAAPVSKPFEIALPPKSWRSFGNPYLFPVAWQSVLDSTRGNAAVKGPYTFRDTAWVPPIEIAALIPWEGYYCYNASDDTVRLRIPSLRARNPQPALAKAAFSLRWDVRGSEGKDAGNWFGALPAAKPGAAAKVSAAVPVSASLWRSPKPESPEGSLRAGFAADGEDGLLQTDFRAWEAAGGASWPARISGMKPGHAYASTFAGLESLPPGMAAAVADPATGAFRALEPGTAFAVEAQPGEETRTLQVFVGTRDYVESQGRAFAAAHPFALELGAYPNPVRGYTNVRFTVPASAQGRSRVRVSVFDMRGRLVGRLAEGILPMGRHQLRWEARDAQGGKVPAGSYRLLIETGTRKLSRPLQVLP